jgi:hypothetical protein
MTQIYDNQTLGSRDHPGLSFGPFRGISLNVMNETAMVQIPSKSGLTAVVTCRVILKQVRHCRSFESVCTMWLFERVTKSKVALPFRYPIAPVRQMAFLKFTECLETLTYL